MKRRPDESGSSKTPFYQNFTSPKHSSRPAESEESARREGICPVYKKCSGCQMQNLPYPDTLRWKQSQIRKLLGRYGHAPFIIGMDDPFHYRNKVQVAFGRTRTGNILSGIWQSREQRIVITDSCQIECPAAAEIAATLRRLLPAFHIEPFDTHTGRGFFRHLLVRNAVHTGELMAVLVGADPIFPQKAAFTRALLKVHPEITTLIFNVNDTDTPLFLGTHEEVLFGKGYIEDTLCGLRFRISPRSFYQVNPVQAEVLYQKALEFAALTGTENVIDAYCGTGTIGLTAASKAKSVLGIENNHDAVRDAIQNAKNNSIQNARFVEADAGNAMQELAKDGFQADVLLMDPPRAGSDRRFLKSALTLHPEKIVYISCNPETLARDLQTLTAGGYNVKKMQPVDMFPWTHHIECVVLLTRNKGQKAGE